jgi:hypothetical protein
MVDYLTISVLVVNIIIALGVFINRTHLNHILCCGCIESDCKRKSEEYDDDIIELNILKENQLEREKNENIINYLNNTVNTKFISDV